MPSSNNSRIANNTFMLYLRMLLTLSVSLYTSRIVIQILGVEDYGIYNIVAGVIVLFGFMNSAMVSGTQRFLSYEIGRKDKKQVSRVFSASLTIYFSIAFFCLILLETIGLWIVNYKLNIDPSRMFAVNVVYQFSIVTFLIGIVKLPFHSLILAYEKMSVYAYVSIMEVFMKLGVVISLQYLVYDKLILYSFLLLIVSLIAFLIDKIYCTKSFDAAKYVFFFDKKLYSKLASFSGYRLLGSSSQMAEKQGANIILNIYIGVLANAAMGISNQVANALNMFVVNFQYAFNPQIVKYYAAGHKELMEKLVFSSSKISFYLLFLLTIPIFFNTHLVIELWLGEVPKYVVIFIQLTLVSFFIEALAGPLWMSILATGKIGRYQIVLSVVLWSFFFLSWLLLENGISLYIVYWTRIAATTIVFIYRIYLLESLVGLSQSLYYEKVLFKVILVSVVSLPIPIFINISLGNGLINLVCTSIVFYLLSIFTIYKIGIDNEERIFIYNKAHNLVNKIIR